MSIISASRRQRFGHYINTLNQFAASPLARLIVFGLFAVQSIVLAFVMHLGVPPDESNHIQFIDYYAHHGLSPNLHGQTPTYYLGDKTREPDFMYHYLMSFVYRVTPLSVHYKYIFIRLLTVLLALAAFYVLTKIFKRIGFSETVTTVSLLILTNLSMVLMMSAAVNNDVMVWLGVSLGILFLLRLKERANLTDLLSLALVIIWGGLFKRDLLPMSLLFGLLALFLIVRHWKVYAGTLKKIRPLSYLLIVLLILGSALFVERIIGNIHDYGTVTPTCEQVQGGESCSVFWASLRAQQLALQPKQNVSPPAFLAKWIGEDTYNIVNVQTQFWRRDVRPARWVTPVLTAVFLMGLAYGVYYEFSQRLKSDKHKGLRLYVLFISLFYILSQLAVNYATFLHYRIFGLALNGRYVIPSLMLLVGFSCFYWTKALANKRTAATLLAVGIILIVIATSGLQLLLRNHQLYEVVNETANVSPVPSYLQ